CASVTSGVVAMDNCHVKQLNCQQSDSDMGCTHTRTFTIRAEDDCGNLSDPCVVTYTWKVDTTAPVFTGCPTGPINLGCNPADSLHTCTTALALVTANDDCDGPITPTCSIGRANASTPLTSRTRMPTPA